MKKNSFPSDRHEVGSDRALAKLLKVSHPTVASWRRRFADTCPSGRDVSAWRTFMESHGLGPVAHSELSDLRRRRAEILGLQAEKLRAEIALAKKTAIPLSEVDAILGRAAQGLKMELYAGVESYLPPKLEGLTTAAMRTVLREWADQFCERMQELNLGPASSDR